MYKKGFIIWIMFVAVGHLLAQQTATATLLFAGDAMQHLTQIESARETDGSFCYDSCFYHIKNEIDAADYAVVNFEVSLGGKPYTGYPSFSAPDEFAQALKRAGFDLFLLANNHTMDRGAKGFLRTLNRLDSMNILYVGGYRNREERSQRYPRLVSVNGFRVAFLNYTYGTNGHAVPSPLYMNMLDAEQILADVELARECWAEVVVVCLHWGQEYEVVENRQQQELADKLVEAGVDLVIGSHPHVVQPMEVRYNPEGTVKSVVAYSLGNFISNMQIDHTTGGAMLKVVLGRDGMRVKIDSVAYSLVGVQRPEKGSRQPFIMRSAAQIDTLSGLPAYMYRYLRDTRANLSEHNIGITEYMF